MTTRWERLGLRTNLLRDDGERAEKVSFIELFFDLVFVFAITQVSHTFVASIDAGHVVDGFLQAAVVLLAVWWVWVYTAWVTNWLVFSTSIPEAFDGHALFTISSMIRFEPVNALNVTRLTIWFGMSAIFWFSGALNSDAWARLALWSVAIGGSVLVTGAAFTQSRRARGAHASSSATRIRAPLRPTATPTCTSCWWEGSSPSPSRMNSCWRIPPDQRGW